MKDHKFGGDWTEDKLTAVSAYLKSYLQVMSNQPFTTHYIDCFAGSGYRNDHNDEEEPLEDAEGEEVPAEQMERYRDGSARKALLLDPGFDRYHFVEKNKIRFGSLEHMTKTEFFRCSVRVLNQRAQEFLPKFCETFGGMNRGVMFLDPYGMSVEWDMLEAIADTGRIDLWLLVATSTLNRLLPRDRKITPGNADKISRFLGCPQSEWFDSIYKEDEGLLLFDDWERDRHKIHFDGLCDYYTKRLKTIFPSVCAKPGPLKNSIGIPIFHLFFASGAQPTRGGGIATRIANHLLNQLRN